MKRLVLVEGFFNDSEAKITALNTCISVLGNQVGAGQLVDKLNEIKADYEALLGFSFDIEPMRFDDRKPPFGEQDLMVAREMFARKHLDGKHVTITGDVVDDDEFLGFEK